MGTLQWHHVNPSCWHPTIAHNGTLQWHHVHSPKVGRHPPPNHSTLQWHRAWHPAMAPRPLLQSWSSCCHPTIARYNGTLQWHHVHSPKLAVTLPPNHSTLQWHPAMAPRPLPQSWPSPSPPTIAHYNGTQQWHTLQWHPTMAPSNGTTSLPQIWLSTPPHPHYNGNVQWHPAMAPRPLHPAMAPWCHVQSAKMVRRPPPLLEVRTPIAIAIWEKIIYIYIFIYLYIYKP